MTTGSARVPTVLLTGGCGFIGSAVARRLAGDHRLIVADDLTDGTKLANVDGLGLAHFLDREELLGLVLDRDPSLDRVEGVVHLGARTDTTEWNGKLVFDLNYRASRMLLDWATHRSVPFVYASSAAVYGRSSSFAEQPANEHPLNPYAWSKLVFDNLVRERLADRPAPVVGLRFFNVYGPRESHKGAMASVIRHFDLQARAGGVVRPFGASHGVGDGEQQRDFVHVDDVADVVRWVLHHVTERAVAARRAAGRGSGPPGPLAGIVNVGTGSARSFADVARLVVVHHRRRGRDVTIAYRPFPAELAPAYQAYTCADLAGLRALGYDGTFRAIDVGIPQYLGWLDEADGPIGEAPPPAAGGDEARADGGVAAETGR